jgi:Holliday junction resolvasome RuvABC endonuclease subunit
MIGSAVRKPLTFAVYPTARGFGWAALSGPYAPHSGGLVEVTKDMNVTCLRKIGVLLDQLEPEMLVLEAFEKRNSARTDRIAKLSRALVCMANDRSIEFAIYTRKDIEKCFETIGARTRYEIAEAIARHVPALAPRLPAKRQPWKADDRRMALFNAAALVFTHYRYQAQFFLDELKDAA